MPKRGFKNSSAEELHGARYEMRLQAALNTLFGTDRHLDHVELVFRDIGAAGAPLRMAALTSAKNLHLFGVRGCHIALDHDVPVQWRNFIIASRRDVTLELQRNLKFLQSLENFLFNCRSLPGPSCIHITQEMNSLGRKVYCEGANRDWWFSSFQITDEAARSRSVTSIPCGCQACLKCLHRNGKLPEGFNVANKKPGS